MEGMRGARSIGHTVRSNHRERHLNCGVRGQDVDTAVREQLSRRLRATEDLEKDRHGRRNECVTVDEEVRAVLSECSTVT